MTNKATKEPKPLTVPRNIHFYRVVETAGEGLQAFQAAQTFAALENLPYQEGLNGRYLAGDDNSFLFTKSDSLTNNCKVRFVKTRRAALPQVERNGNFTDLNIAQDAGLAELIHCMFFPNGIIGADFNFYGPRLHTLANYIRNKSNGNPTLQFLPLLRSDILNQLNQLKNITLLRIRVKPSLVELIKEADASLGAAFEASRSLGQSKSLEIIIQPEQNSGPSILERVKNLAPKILQKVETSEKKAAQLLNFEVRGKGDSDNRIQEIDLLQAQFLISKQIVKQGTRNRVLDSTSAYDAIYTAHNDLQTQISLAPELSI